MTAHPRRPLPSRSRHFTFACCSCLLLLTALLRPSPAAAAYVWVEAEKPAHSTMNRHPWWYDQVKRDQLSGGDFISNFNDAKPGEADYRFDAPAGGEWQFWVRANPVQASLSYRLNGGAWTAIDLEKNQIGNTNIAADGKPDLRFIAWVGVGKVALTQGANTIAFRMDSKTSNHGLLDCFVFVNEPFQPQGALKPDQIAGAAGRAAEGNQGWFAFNPPADPYDASAAGWDLRSLNEPVAGEGGFISVKGGQFVHGKTGKPVRFWAVNGPPHDLKDTEGLSQCARLLAKHGVNMVRVHGGYFDENGEIDLAKVRHAQLIVAAMKQQGIYSHFSTYFPLWLDPKPGNPWLLGYDGKHHPFAALYFNHDFQKQYQSWWKALLTTPDEKTGQRLVDDPAVSSLEMINEDSYFFWTFSDANLPDAEMKMLEAQFGDWLKNKYGSIEAAAARWQGVKSRRDDFAHGRAGFRPWFNVFTEKKQRDKDAVAFLAESQKKFYEETIQFLRGLGFKGAICTSNWVTANPQVLGPVERYTYLPGDFIDRHGYFDCNQQGENNGWSIRDGHTYSDRSALRFDPPKPGQAKAFVHPAMDIHYDGKPSMISETTFNRPNRYRSEAPLYYACYGALQDSDCIVHFALDGSRWTTKPGYFVQPWTLMSPAMMGQFPAAALIYRQGLVSPGETLADLNLKVPDVLDLAGTPLPQDASFDELRLKDVPKGMEIKPGNVIDPLVHYAGRTNVNYSAAGGPAKLADLSKLIDRPHQTVTSSTGQLKLDYGKGVLTINAPAAQGIGGALHEAGTVTLKDMAITSEMDLGHIVAVSLDGKPLADSGRILLQVMSEEKPADFQTTPVSEGVQRITNLGHDPWMVRDIRGTVKFNRPDAARLKVTPLDDNGYPMNDAGSGGAGDGAAEIKLRPATVYYLISR